MKTIKHLYAILLILLSFNSYSQSFISYEKTNILNISINYTFSQNVYVYANSYYDVQTSAMAAYQAKYDRGFYIVKTEYDKLMALRLINTNNIALLTEFKKVNKPFFESIKNADLTKSSDLQKCINGICAIYEYECIRSEIELLKSCNTELSRIKRQDPDNYIYTKRYKAIVKVLEELETCNQSEIKNLSWEKTELNM